MKVGGKTRTQCPEPVFVGEGRSRELGMWTWVPAPSWLLTICLCACHLTLWIPASSSIHGWNVLNTLYEKLFSSPQYCSTKISWKSSQKIWAAFPPLQILHMIRPQNHTLRFLKVTQEAAALADASERIRQCCPHLLDIPPLGDGHGHRNT